MEDVRLPQTCLQIGPNTSSINDEKRSGGFPVLKMRVLTCLSLQTHPVCQVVYLCALSPPSVPLQVSLCLDSMRTMLSWKKTNEFLFSLLPKDQQERLQRSLSLRSTLHLLSPVNPRTPPSDFDLCNEEPHLTGALDKLSTQILRDLSKLHGNQ